MLTEKQTAFLKVWPDHQTWPVEMDGKVVPDTYNMLHYLSIGRELRFQAPLDSDGEPLKEGEWYVDGENKPFMVEKIVYEDQRVSVSVRWDFPFFSCPTFRKHRPEPAIPDGWYRLGEKDTMLHDGDKIWDDEWIKIRCDCVNLPKRLAIRRLPEPEPKPEKWRPEYWQEYWSFSADYTRKKGWQNDSVDKLRFSLGIVFRTEEEAKKRRKELGL